MYRLLLSCACAFGFYLRVDAAYLPAYITPCKAFDPDLSKCWSASIENLRPYLAAGIKELQVPPAEPLRVSKLSVSRKKSNTGVYDVYFKNTEFTGFGKFVLLDATIDLEAPIIKLKIGFPKLKWVTTGLVDGMIIGFPLNGTFRSDIDFGNLALDLVLDGHDYNVYGRRHIDWTRGSIEVTYDSIGVTARDIYQEPYLMQAFNNAINQNAFLLEDHVKPLIENTIGKYIIDLINSLHATYSRDVLYSKY